MNFKVGINSKFSNLLCFLFLSCSFLFNSCEEGIEVFSDGSSVPIVYCLLDPFDTVQYVRLSKTYIIEQGNNPIISTGDSLIYPGNVQVSLDRWENGDIVETILFNEVNNIQKEEGLFPVEKLDLYASYNDILPETKYTLNIYLEDRGLIISAYTVTIGDLKVIDPFPLPQRRITLNSNMDYTIRCNLAQEAWIYQTITRFNYLEIYGQDTIAKFFDWKQNVKQPDYNSADYVTFHLNGPIFYQEMLKNIEANPDVTRKSVDMSFLFYYGGMELNYYVISISPSSSALQEKPNYTNFTNCEGIFSSLSSKEITKVQLSKIFIDSIANSIWTGHLGFVNSKDSLYIIGGQ